MMPDICTPLQCNSKLFAIFLLQSTYSSYDHMYICHPWQHALPFCWQHLPNFDLVFHSWFKERSWKTFNSDIPPTLKFHSQLSLIYNIHIFQFSHEAHSLLTFPSIKIVNHKAPQTEFHKIGTPWGWNKTMADTLNTNLSTASTS